MDWGYEVTIADWGQLYDRLALDFDEYLAEGQSSYNLISAEEYLSLKDFQSFADLFKPIISRCKFLVFGERARIRRTACDGRKAFEAVEKRSDSDKSSNECSHYTIAD